MPQYSLISKTFGQFLLKAKPILDHAKTASIQPFQQAKIIKPRLKDKYYSWVHYGMFFASLPAPHHYLNIMTLIGTTSSMAFDINQIIGESPRHTATLFSGTSATKQSLLKAYSFNQDVHFAADNSRLQFGDELVIEGVFPHFKIKGHYQELDLSFEFDLNVTDKASYFLKNMVYDHVSLLAQYSGLITHQGKTIKSSGLTTYEYARAIGMHSLIKSKLNEKHKIPLDFFTYQIINLNDTTQLLLTKANVLGQESVKHVYIRHLDYDKPSEIYSDVDFEIVEYYPNAFIAPSGESMYLPKVMRWAVKHQNKELFAITAHVEDDFRYGHGKGYVSIYQFEGMYQNKSIRGQGYLEYIDLSL